MKLRTKTFWVTAALLALAGFLLIPELRYQRALRKYRLGTSVDEIERAYGTALVLQPSGNILPTDPAPSEEEKRRHPAYFIRVPHAEVVFNDYRVVIRVFRCTPLQKLGVLSEYGPL